MKHISYIMQTSPGNHEHIYAAILLSQRPTILLAVSRLIYPRALARNGEGQVHYQYVRVHPVRCWQRRLCGEEYGFDGDADGSRDISADV